MMLVFGTGCTGEVDPAVEVGPGECAERVDIPAAACAIGIVDEDAWVVLDPEVETTGVVDEVVESLEACGHAGASWVGDGQNRPPTRAWDASFPLGDYRYHVGVDLPIGTAPQVGDTLTFRFAETVMDWGVETRMLVVSWGTSWLWMTQHAMHEDPEVPQEGVTVARSETGPSCEDVTTDPEGFDCAWHVEEWPVNVTVGGESATFGPGETGSVGTVDVAVIASQVHFTDCITDANGSSLIVALYQP